MEECSSFFFYHPLVVYPWYASPRNTRDATKRRRRRWRMDSKRKGWLERIERSWRAYNFLKSRRVRRHREGESTNLFHYQITPPWKYKPVPRNPNPAEISLSFGSRLISPGFRPPPLVLSSESCLLTRSYFPPWWLITHEQVCVNVCAKGE